MATRLQGQVYSMRGNTRYQVFIDDGSPSTGTIDEVRLVSLNIRHEAASKDIDANLLLSRIKVVFRVENAAQESVFSDMAGSAETRFKVRVLKDGALFYIGFVLLDLLTVEDISGGYNLSIEATDGIGRLKSIDYDGGGTFYDDYETIHEHLKTILSAVPLTDYYSTGEEYFRVNSTLWPNGLTPDGTTDQLDLIRCSYRAFRSIDRQGDVKFSSYYDVLLEFCKAFGLRFMYANGRYVITDIVDYARTVGSVRFLRYDIDGVALSAEILGGGGGTQWDAWTRESGELSAYEASTKDAVTPAGGKITHLPALRAVDWSYKHYSKQNTLPTSEVWTNGSNPSPSIQNFVTAATLRLRVSAAAQLEVVPPVGEDYPAVPVHVVVGMRLWVIDADSNGEILTRTYNIVGTQVNYNVDRWVGGVSGVQHPFVFRVPEVAAATPTFQIETLTAVVPLSGTLRIQFFISDILKNGATWAGADVNYTIHSPYIETTLDGSVTDQYNFSNFTAGNNAFAGNSVTLERSVRLGDGPSDNTFGRFEYFENPFWARTTAWRKYAGGTYQDTTARLHGAIRSRDILALQEQPRQKLQGTIIINDYSPEYIYLRATKRYLPYKADHNLVDDEVTGDWFEIGYEPNSVTDPTEAPSDDNPIGGEEGGVVPDTSGPISTGGPLTSEDGQIPPGLLAPTLTTISSGIDGEVPESVPADTIPVTDTPTDLPLFEGDVLVITHPTTGQQQNVTVTYNSELGVPAAAQDGSTSGSFQYFGPNGVVWLVADDTNVAVEGFTPSFTIPQDSFLQFDAAYLARLRALLRIDHIDGNVFGFTESLSIGLQDWFWRPERRIGWHIRKVHFAFAQAGTGTAKVNLKYYDATGFRYTIATHNATAGLGSVQDAFATVDEGYYRVEVETLTGAVPKGLTVIIELIKILPSA